MSGRGGGLTLVILDFPFMYNFQDPIFHKIPNNWQKF